MAFILTENTYRVAVQLADRWATAVEAQATRIREPKSLLTPVPDQWLQVIALNHVVVAAEMARKHVPREDTQRLVDAAINEFLQAVIIRRDKGLNQRKALKLARDVLAHFDKYWCGTGDEQEKQAGKLSREELAQRYRPDFGSTAQDLPTLRLGPPPPASAIVEIDLAGTAPVAARKLVRTLTRWSP